MKLLRPKYIVKKIADADAINIDQMPLPADVMLATNPNDVDSPFVLLPRKDPSAFAALVTYSQVCEPQLAQEIAEWLEKVADAEPRFGSQGARNYASVRMQAVHDIQVNR